jgi:hypothetical protein
MHPPLPALAQSGRVVAPPSQPTPLPGQLNGKRSALAPGDDEYKLVFATSYEGRLSYRLDRENKQLRQQLRSELDSFLQQLNKVGEQGYRLRSAIYSRILVGLVRFDERQYEYASFDTTSRYFFSVGAFEKSYAPRAREGFHLIHHTSLNSYCEDIDPDRSYAGQNCEFFHRFLLERPEGPEKPREYLLVGSNPFRTKSRVELSSLINEKRTEGFYPTIAVSGYEVLLEPITDGDDHLTDKPNAQVVRHSSFNNLKKEVNDLANRGYRLALSDDGIAVMIRRSETATPVKYVWLRADKSLDRQLDTLQQSGAVYRMNLADYVGLPTILVFEQTASNEKHREYKVLKFEFQLTQNEAEKKVYISLAPSARDAMRVLNRLAKEGFVVRDLFISNQISVLLERSP